MKRLITLFIIAPIAILVIWLAVTNRTPVTVAIPPDVGGQPIFTFSAPLYMLIFGSVLLGLVLGSMATWFKQGKHRKAAREQKVEATKWHFEADKAKERADELAEKVALAEGTTTPKSLGLPSPSKAA